jgi:hypothetical protein
MNLVNRPAFTEANSIKDLQQLLIRWSCRLGYPQLATVAMFGTLLAWAAALCYLHWAVNAAPLVLGLCQGGSGAFYGSVPSISPVCVITRLGLI